MGRSSVKEVMTDASLYTIGWGGRVSVHDRLGGRTMLRDPAGGRISADERVEQTANARVSDEYPHQRDLERESLFIIILIGLDGVQED